MSLNKLRYSLTEHTEKFFFTYENFKLLIHPSVMDTRDLLNRLEDDINLMPEIDRTSDNTDIKLKRYGYNEDLYSKSEILAFTLASISEDWNIIKGIDLSTDTIHFWLKHENIIYDPSLAIITKEDIYSEFFQELIEIKRQDIRQHLMENNNLYKFYEKSIFKNFRKNKNDSFSINFINKLTEEFNENITREYILDNDKMEHIKKYFMFDDFIELRQVLSQKRKSYLKSNNIAVHPSIDDSILETIEKTTKRVSRLMQQEYDIYFDYYNLTLGNCYGLSIMFHLFNESFKLIQGGIPYQIHELSITTNHFYQHSWLEKDDIIYDPAFKIITPKDLYYTFVQKQDEYSKEETENILRRIGFNLTHFRDFMNGIQIGNNETISYRSLVNKMDSPEMKEEGEKLLSFVKKYKHY